MSLITCYLFFTAVVSTPFNTFETCDGNEIRVQLHCIIALADLSTTVAIVLFSYAIAAKLETITH